LELLVLDVRTVPAVTLKAAGGHHLVFKASGIALRELAFGNPRIDQFSRDPAAPLLKTI
jgi:hypothetical protein